MKAMNYPDEQDRELTPKDGPLYDDVNGWGDILGDKWKTVRVPDSHFQLFAEPYVSQVAACIADSYMHQNLPVTVLCECALVA